MINNVADADRKHRAKMNKITHKKTNAFVPLFLLMLDYKAYVVALLEVKESKTVEEIIPLPLGLPAPLLTDELFSRLVNIYRSVVEWIERLLLKR